MPALDAMWTAQLSGDYPPPGVAPAPALWDRLGEYGFVERLGGITATLRARPAGGRIIFVVLRPVLMVAALALVSTRLAAMIGLALLGPALASDFDLPWSGDCKLHLAGAADGRTRCSR